RLMAVGLPRESTHRRDRARIALLAGPGEPGCGGGGTARLDGHRPRDARAGRDRLRAHRVLAPRMAGPPSVGVARRGSRGLARIRRRRSTKSIPDGPSSALQITHICVFIPYYSTSLMWLRWLIIFSA